MSKKEQDNLFDKNELKDLRQKGSQESKLIYLIAIAIGLVLFMLLNNVWSIYDLYNNDSITRVKCPRSFDASNPIVLQKFSKVDKRNVDNLIKNFIIKYTKMLYPREKEHLKLFYTYVANHSKGFLKDRYDARLDSIDEIEKQMENGVFSKFYIKDEHNIQIRKIDSYESKNAWKVVVKGYLHRNSGMMQEKTTPRIEFEVHEVKPTINNPEGLVVKDFNNKYILDPISETEIDV